MITKKIEVIGLGAGDLEQLPLGVYRKLLGHSRLYLRTKEHPVVAELEKEGLIYESFDHLYEAESEFQDVYKRIVEQLLLEAEKGPLLYAVPGHPLVAEMTVQLLFDEEEEGNCTVTILGGQSFLDPIFASLKIDPIEGFQLLDGSSLERDQLDLRQHILIGQVYDQISASNVKLTLMEEYPANYEVAIVRAAGSKLENIHWTPLYELDHGFEVDNLTTLYVPPIQEEELLYHQFSSLRKVIAELRGPNGCPWDQEQTHDSLKRYLLEESYELIEAIDLQDDDKIIEELGDVLLQVMLHAQIGEDEEWYSIDDVIRGITEKMIRRHPHVFSDVEVDNAEEVLLNWEEIKKQEKGHELEGSLLDSVSKALPSLLRARDYQKKAAKVGFDWKAVEPMWEKVQEEIAEFNVEATKAEEDQSKLEAEFGDVLFALVNVARFYKIDPEVALSRTNAKFYSRFRYIEECVRGKGQRLEELSLEELDVLWNEAKELEKGSDFS